MTAGLSAYQQIEELQEAPEVSSGGEIDMMCEDPDLFCETHLDLASLETRRRKEQMQRRLAFVQDIWNDADRFDAIVASGRYLKLCNLTEWISDYDDRATARLRNEILAAWRDAAA